MARLKKVGQRKKGQLAAVLGLVAGSPAPAPKTTRRSAAAKANWTGTWTEEQLQLVHRHYGQMLLADLAALVGKSKAAVSHRAGKFGLRSKKSPPWSAEELEYLETNWGRFTLPKIARALGRTEAAVILKAKRLGLGPTKFNLDVLNARELSDAVGVDIHAVTDYWIPKCGLPAHRRVTRKVYRFWRIKIANFWTWAEQNQDRFDTRRFRKGALGKEPDWMQLKRQRDRHLPARMRQKWTPAEDARLIMLFKAGKSYREIGAELGRTAEGCGRRLARLGWENVWNGRAAAGSR